MSCQMNLCVHGDTVVLNQIVEFAAHQRRKAEVEEGTTSRFKGSPAVDEQVQRLACWSLGWK